MVRALGCGAQVRVPLGPKDWKTLTVHPAANGYLINFRDGLRRRKERIGPCLSYAVPKTPWGSNIPLPRRPLGYGHLYLLPYTNGYITIEITPNIEIKLSSGILSLLGIVSKHGRLTAGRHIGDKIIDVAKPKDLRIYLDQINTATTYNNRTFDTAVKMSICGADYKYRETLEITDYLDMNENRIKELKNSQDAFDAVNKRYMNKRIEYNTKDLEDRLISFKSNVENAYNETLQRL